MKNIIRIITLSKIIMIVLLLLEIGCLHFSVVNKNPNELITLIILGILIISAATVFTFIQTNKLKKDLKKGKFQ